MRARQQAVEELRDRVDLREELAVLAEEARTGVDPVHLARGAKRRQRCGRRACRLRVRLPPCSGVAGFAALWFTWLRVGEPDRR